MADRALSHTFPMPRLLPLTILAMAALLIVKSATIVLAATAPANAAAPAAAIVPPAKAAEPAAKADAHAAATHATEKPEPAAAPVAIAAEPPVSDSERALLVDLRQRRQQLDAREATLATREATLAAVEKRLAGRVDELTALQARLEDLERERKARDEGNWRGMVKLYESMKPRDAAVIFNDLDLPVLLPVIDRMKEAKAATILAAMQPERARQVTTELAQLRARQNSVDTPASPPASSSAARPAGG